MQSAHRVILSEIDVLTFGAAPLAFAKDADDAVTFGIVISALNAKTLPKLASNTSLAISQPL